MRLASRQKLSRCANQTIARGQSGESQRATTVHSHGLNERSLKFVCVGCYLSDFGSDNGYERDACARLTPQIMGKAQGLI